MKLKYFESKFTPFILIRKIRVVICKIYYSLSQNYNRTDWVNKPICLID